ALKEKYRNNITIYTGFEADYIENLQRIEQMRFPQTDFIIGGVHFLGCLPSGRAWECDHSPAFFEQGLHEIFEDKIAKMHKQFFNATNAMILQKPDIIAHIDLLKKFNRGNRFFDEFAPEYRNLLYESVELAAQNEVIIEINTRGFYKGDFPSFYPDAETVTFGKTKGALFTISSDTHRAGEFCSGIREAAEMLIACGVSNIYYKIKGQTIEVALSEYMNKLKA
ncbi:MAG TPA: hypothetical protein DCQ31_08655, partial [Bacteroidales bacterium]|nr:hypothetical protein [Bacteroidales bacterium]